MRTSSMVPSARHHATVWPLRIVPWRTRHSARRPTYGDASRLVTSAWNGWPSSYSGAGMCSSSSSNSGFSPSALAGDGRRSRSVGVVGIERRPAGACVAVHDREVDLVLVGVEVEEQLLHLVHDLGDARVGAVDLVDHEDHGQAGLERLAQHEAGLRQRALARVDEEQHAVDHREAPLDLAAEVGVAGRVDDVDLHVAVTHGGVLGEDRDALLALEVHRVHDPVGDLLVGAERAGLAEHGVDERGLAVVDVGDDGDVAEGLGVGARGHQGLSRRGSSSVAGNIESTGGRGVAGPDAAPLVP